MALKKIILFILVLTSFQVLPQKTSAAQPGEREFLQGVILFDHGTTESDKRAAFDLLSQSAAKGHAMGTYYLGRAYLESNGVQEDRQKAFEYILRAADADNRIAQGKVCELYRLGWGIEKNIEKAIHYCMKSAEAKWPTGYRRLGEIYQFEKSDYAQASDWYEKAANLLERDACGEFFANGDPQAQYLLGWLLLHQEEVKDQQKGLKYMNLAANNNSLNAQYEMGVYYLGTPQNMIDPAKSFDYFNKAALGGHKDAPTFVAALYWDGIGTERSIFDAYKWTIIALRTVSDSNRAVVTRNESGMRAHLSPEEISKAQIFAANWQPKEQVGYKSQFFVKEDFQENMSYECAKEKTL